VMLPSNGQACTIVRFYRIGSIGARCGLSSAGRRCDADRWSVHDLTVDCAQIRKLSQEGGTNSAYLAARLKRDHPEIVSPCCTATSEMDGKKVILVGEGDTRYE
jgi:hypothetical protein